jgi:hypothetical protein
MKINITKNGEKQSYNIINSWEDVTLESWAALIAGNTTNSGKAGEAITSLTALSDMPARLIKELSLDDISKLMKMLADIQARANSELVNKITVNKIEYGFHPNLEEITLGEYADLETCISDGIGNNLHKIMAILYRPITETKNNFYTIEAYDADTKKLREQEFKTMPAEQVQSALVFFWTFVEQLSKILPLFLTMRLKAATI